MDVNIFLFPNFETLDVFGPVEIFGKIDEYNISYYSEYGGSVKSAQHTEIMTYRINEASEDGILVVPGGQGTRILVNNEKCLEKIRLQVENSRYCLSICTGAALLAKCGVLDYKHATSNKKVFDWVKSIGARVAWIDRARWCVDGKIYTASGVSAGIDMTLGFIADRFGEKMAEEIADQIEYI